MKERTSSKTSLFLMELILAIFFFAFCSAICMSVFAKSKIEADLSRNISNSMLKAQSAAEIYKASEGDIVAVSELLQGTYSGETVSVNYDENWHPVIAAGKYILTLESDSDGIYFTAQISVELDDGTPLFEISAATSKK